MSHFCKTQLNDFSDYSGVEINLLRKHENTEYSTATIHNIELTIRIRALKGLKSVRMHHLAFLLSKLSLQFQYFKDNIKMLN